MTKPKRKYIREAKDAYQYLQAMKFLKKEHFHGLYLDSRNKLVYDEVISIGSLTANIIHPREVFRPAIEHSAAAVIVAHNHPSGDPHPSEHDLRVTARLKSVGELLNIPLLDHLIIADEGFVSLKDEGKMGD